MNKFQSISEYINATKKKAIKDLNKTASTRVDISHHFPETHIEIVQHHFDTIFHVYYPKGSFEVSKENAIDLFNGRDKYGWFTI